MGDSSSSSLFEEQVSKICTLENGSSLYLTSLHGTRRFIRESKRAEKNRKIWVLSVMNQMEPFGLPPDQCEFRCLQDVAEDVSTLEAILPFTFEFISEHLASPNTDVVVHCLMGVSRSVSVVTWYLVKSQNISPLTALKEIQAIRPVAQPIEAFYDLLWEMYINDETLGDIFVL